MLPTLEVRWFIKSRIPKDVLSWFHQGEMDPEEQYPRVDYYLRLGDIDQLGIKLRGGRLEIKRRQIDHGILHFHERLSGRVEGWHKWSFDLGGNETVRTEVGSPDSTWVAVRKARMLRAYAVINQTEVQPVKVGQPVFQGCMVDLSEVNVEGSVWWSLCFEAIGEQPGVHDVLSLVIRAVLAGNNPPTLQVKNSFSYPYWLNHYTML